MTTPAYARGSKAWGLCKRCGLRFLLNDLVLDEHIPGLRVCVDCFDTKQPQERLVDVGDPQALWRPSPDDTGGATSTPVLALAGDGSPRFALSWTSTEFNAQITAGYRLYRSTDGITFSLLTTLPAGVDVNTFLFTETLTYADTDFVDSQLYYYYVVAYDAVGRTSRSNTVSGTASIVVRWVSASTQSGAFDNLAGSITIPSIASFNTDDMALIVIHWRSNDILSRWERGMTLPAGWRLIARSGSTRDVGTRMPAFLVAYRFKQPGDTTASIAVDTGTVMAYKLHLIRYANVRKAMPVDNFRVEPVFSRTIPGHLTDSGMLPTNMRANGVMSALFAITGNAGPVQNAVYGTLRNSIMTTTPTWGAVGDTFFGIMDRLCSNDEGYNLVNTLHPPETGQTVSGLTLNNFIGEDLVAMPANSGAATSQAWRLTPAGTNTDHNGSFTKALIAGDKIDFSVYIASADPGVGLGGWGYCSITSPSAVEVGNYWNIGDTGGSGYGGIIGTGFDRFSVDRDQSSGYGTWNENVVHCYYTAPVSGTYTFRMGTAGGDGGRVHAPPNGNEYLYIGGIVVQYVPNGEPATYAKYSETYANRAGTRNRTWAIEQTLPSWEASPSYFLGFELVHVTQALEQARLVAYELPTGANPIVSGKAMNTNPTIGACLPFSGAHLSRPIYNPASFPSAPTKCYVEARLDTVTGTPAGLIDAFLGVFDISNQNPFAHTQGGIDGDPYWGGSNDGITYTLVGEVSNTGFRTAVAPYAAADVLGFAVDWSVGTYGTVRVYKNGAFQRAEAMNGFSSALRFLVSRSYSQQHTGWTVRTRDSEFQYKPTGYSALDWAVA